MPCRGACVSMLCEATEAVRRTERRAPIESGSFSAESAIHFCSLGWTCRHFCAICCVVESFASAAQSAHERTGLETYVVRVAFDKALARVGVVEHLVEEKHALLHPVELLRHLLLVVGLLLRLLRARRESRES